MIDEVRDSAQTLWIPFGDGAIESELHMPPRPHGLAVLTHESGHGLQSPRNRFVARLLRERGFGTLLMDCGCGCIEESEIGRAVSRDRVEQLARRIEAVAEWVADEERLRDLAIGYAGSGIGGAAMLLSAAFRPDIVRAVVLRGARPDAVPDALVRVRVPTLMVVGSRDLPALHASRQALQVLPSSAKGIEIVPGAGHTFEEPGALSAAALHAANWFAQYLADVDRAIVASAGERHETSGPDEEPRRRVA